MKANRIILTAVSVVTTVAIVACNKVDLSGLESRLDNLENKTSQMEKTIEEINRNIDRIDKLLKEMADNISISKVTYNNSAVTLEFSDGEILTIETGSDGIPAPVVGIKLYEGRYWWTMTIDGITDWLRDSNGNMIPVDGVDGKDGKDGKNAPQRDDEVIKPILSVDGEGYWIVSFDNGKNFSRLKDSEGHEMVARPIDATSDGGVYLFSACKDNGDSVELTLINGEKLTFEKFIDITIHFDKTDEIEFKDDKAEVPFVINGDCSDIQIISLDKGSVVSEVVMTSANTGILKVTRFGNWQYSSRIVVMLITPRHTITTQITFHATDKRIDEILTLEVTETFEMYMDINRGFYPPLVSGTYLAKPFKCSYCSYTDKNNHNITGETLSPRFFRFTEQGADGEINVDFINEDGTCHLGENMFNICGNGKKFTAYAIVETRDSLGKDNVINKKSVYIISGQKENSSIKNLRFGEYIVSKSHDALSYFMPESTYMTFSVSSAVAAEWPEKL